MIRKFGPERKSNTESEEDSDAEDYDYEYNQMMLETLPIILIQRENIL